MLTYFQNGETLMITLDGKQHPVSKGTHPLFSDIVQAVETEDLEYLRSNLSVTKAVATKLEGRVEFDGEKVWLNMPSMDVRTELGAGITRRIKRLAAEGMPFGAVLKFLDNLIDNPSPTSVEELLEFLEVNELPFTPDGHFIAYKRVRSNMMDSYTGMIDNSPGQIVEMSRDDVDDNRERTCSSGLHFCSMGYLSGSGYGGEGNPIVLLKINPRDVVSIPTDYDNTKGRCCRYEVVDLHRSNSSKDDYVTETPVYTEEFEDEEESITDFSMPVKNYFFTSADKCKSEKRTWVHFTGFDSEDEVIEWLWTDDGADLLDTAIRKARIQVGAETRLVLRRSETNHTQMLSNQIQSGEAQHMERATKYWFRVAKNADSVSIHIDFWNGDTSVLA